MSEEELNELVPIQWLINRDKRISAYMVEVDQLERRAEQAEIERDEAETALGTAEYALMTGAESDRTEALEVANAILQRRAGRVAPPEEKRQDEAHPDWPTPEEKQP